MTTPEETTMTRVTKRGGPGRWLGVLAVLTLGLTLLVMAGGLVTHHAAADATDDDSYIESRVDGAEWSCEFAGGTAEVDYDLDADGHIVSVTVTCHYPGGGKAYCTINRDTGNCMFGGKPVPPGPVDGAMAGGVIGVQPVLNAPSPTPSVRPVNTGAIGVVGALPGSGAALTPAVDAPVQRILTSGALSSGPPSSAPTPSPVAGSVVMSGAAGGQAVTPRPTPAATPPA